MKTAPERIICPSPLNNVVTVKATCTISMILQEKSAFNQPHRKKNISHQPVKRTDFTKQLTSSPTLYSISFLPTSIASLLSAEALCCSALFVDNSLFK